MGFGDHLMVTADARDVYQKHRVKVIVGPRAEWSPLFEGNPHILKKPEPGCGVLENYTGNRPYIREIRDGRAIFSDYKVRPGDIYLTFKERFWAQKHCPDDFVIVEPHTKGTVYADNKDWGFDKFQKLVEGLKLKWLQIGSKKTLKGVKFIKTDTFREACAVMERASLYVGPEGGLHHAAAALGIPAVVIFGGCASPQVTGYDFHANLASDEPCGSLRPCKHCRAAMDKIKVSHVADAIGKVNEASR